MSLYSLQTVVQVVQSLVTAVTGLTTFLKKSLNNIPPKTVLGNPTGVDGPLVAMTGAQIVTIIQNNAGSISMRQIKAALAQQNEMVVLFDQLPGDMTNAYNIAWWNATSMLPTDPFIVGFLQPELGYTSAQVAALLALAQTFPF